MVAASCWGPDSAEMPYLPASLATVSLGRTESGVLQLSCRQAAKFLSEQPNMEKGNGIGALFIRSRDPVLGAERAGSCSTNRLKLVIMNRCSDAEGACRALREDHRLLFNQ